MSKKKYKEYIKLARESYKENNGPTLRQKKNDRIGFHKTYDINILMNVRSSNQNSILSLQRPH